MMSAALAERFAKEAFPIYFELSALSLELFATNFRLPHL